MRFLTTLCLLLVASAFLTSEASAQRARLGKDYYEDHHNGYKFRFPDKWLITPVESREAISLSKLAQMDGPRMATRVGNMSVNFKPRINVYKFEQRAAITREEEDGGGGLRSRVETDSSRKTIEEHLKSAFRDLRDLMRSGETEDKKMKKGMVAKRDVFTAFDGVADVVFDCYTFRLDDYDVAIMAWLPQQHYPKWEKVFYQAAKTFEVIERVDAAKAIDENSSYEDKLAYHTSEVSRTPGWNLLETPSKRYFVVTSSKDQRFIDKVVSRLEHSRDLFERDFPPDRPIDAISVVRICSTLEEFHKYGKTGGGVAGWFSPLTAELVIVDFKNYDRNLTYGVMTHEAFHQYCHFLFDEAEAHRWFDEGHGDYYGAFEFKGRKAIVKAKMKGEDRLTGIRAQIRQESFTPLATHVRQNHGQWQSRGVASYQQSWSIIYMLRQGMLGRVPKKVWKPEYADVIPEYMRVLHEETQKAYERIRQRKKDRAETEGRELSEEEASVNRFDLRESDKEEIWNKAIGASWGQIDIDQFEKHWKEYVLRHLKD